MEKAKRVKFTAIAFASVCLLLLVSLQSSAQSKSTREEYQAQAMGQGTQLGQTFNVTISIEEYSTPDERQAFLDAFNAGGSQALFKALSKAKSKGRMAVTGTLGYDISFVRKIQTPEGVKIRVLTNRPITFGEARSDSNSMDFNLSVVELTLSNEKGKSTGILLPACQATIDKKTHELGIENYQNPWKLADVLDRTKK